MAFRVVTNESAPAAAGDVLLVKDSWNDWFIWTTQFFAIAIVENGRRVRIGQVKIARIGMSHQDANSSLPDQFSALDEGWFSIGQSENYYETLNELGAEYRSWFLQVLQDCAQDIEKLNRYSDEEVLRRSLLRDIDMDRVRNRFHRLANGDAALTPFAFTFRFPDDPLSPEPVPELSFRVTPGSKPPSNVHVLIGRNGVGKTRCFDLLSRSFLGLSVGDGTHAGTLGPLDFGAFGPIGNTHGFAGLVTVSFSPFDAYGPLVATSAELNVRYAYVGLIREAAPPASQEGGSQSELPPGQGVLTIKSRYDLMEDFVKSVAVCRSGARRSRWARALSVLEADPLFEEANVSAVADAEATDWDDRARRLFRRLSSGHSVVLLTITRLVELVEEKSLVLIDEPEGHLHPPLLSAFVRALSDLLIDRNGVAIIATHSPVVLQEVPKKCAWVLSRSGRSARVDRPESETFGENVSLLTREVFGLEVVQTGFHRMIAEAVEGRTYQEVLDFFGSKLGGEARALARALTLVPPVQPDVDEEDS